MNSPVDRALALGLLGDMLRIRRLEDVCAEKYAEGKIRGFLHLEVGEEAIPAGILRVLTPEDNLFCTYREHGHALLRGVSAERIMAELYGKYEGCSRGRGGSMHLFDASKRFYGGNAIVAGHLPLAVGMALADKMRGRNAVTACFFGEGAMAEGAFHESLNLAALWNVPALFVCENNLYAMGTALARSESQTDLTEKAAAYNVRAVKVDAMDALAVHAAAQEAAAYVRAGHGPCFLECATYRFRAHSAFDPELYRSKAEIQEWRKRDPIRSLERRLREAQMLDDAAYARLEAAAAEETQRAVAFAEQAPWEPLESLTRDVYTREAGHE